VENICLSFDCLSPVSVIFLLVSSHDFIPCSSRYKSRQYCVGLSARGRDAISRVEGLWEAVQQAGVPTSQFVVHTGSIVIKETVI
jgi:hypothetical protein